MEIVLETEASKVGFAVCEFVHSSVQLPTCHFRVASHAGTKPGLAYFAARNLWAQRSSVSCFRGSFDFSCPFDTAEFSASRQVHDPLHWRLGCASPRCKGEEAVSLLYPRWIVPSAILTSLWYPSASLGKDHPGTWETGSFTHANVICFQKWSCVPEPGLYDAACKPTPAESTSGTCSADGGAVDSCSSCVAPPPKTPCKMKCPDSSPGSGAPKPGTP